MIQTAQYGVVIVTIFDRQPDLPHQPDRVAARMFCPCHRQSIRMTPSLLHLDEKGLDQRLVVGRSMEEGLKNKLAFTNAKPAPVQMEAWRAAIGAQRGKVAAAQAQLAEAEYALGALEENYRGALEVSAASASQAVTGDAAQSPAARLPLGPAGAPKVGAPAALENVRGSHGDMSGEVDWFWDAAPCRAVYCAEVSTTPIGPWTQVYSGTRSKLTSKGHPPRREVFLRAKCNCGGCESAWSQVAGYRAPGN